MRDNRTSISGQNNFRHKINDWRMKLKACEKATMSTWRKKPSNHEDEGRVDRDTWTWFNETLQDIKNMGKIGLVFTQLACTVQTKQLLGDYRSANTVTTCRCNTNEIYSYEICLSPTHKRQRPPLPSAS